MDLDRKRTARLSPITQLATTAASQVTSVQSPGPNRAIRLQGDGLSCATPNGYHTWRRGCNRASALLSANAVVDGAHCISTDSLVDLGKLDAGSRRRDHGN